MAIKTSASYTIMDYNDGLSIISKINSNHPDQVTYDPASRGYNPDWSVTSLALTPNAYIAGRTGDIISKSINKKWYYRRSGETDWTLITNGANGFTINAGNVLGYSSNDLFDNSHRTVEFKFAYTYHDETLNIDFDYEVAKSISRISNGTSVVIARAWSDGGEQFKNKKEPPNIELQSELIRGITTDKTDLEYQWQKIVSGIWTNITGKTQDNIVVHANDVDGSATYRCVIKDIDPISDSHLDVFNTNAITILDFTDPYQAEIASSEGAFIKNGVGSTVLSCRVFQDGEEISTDPSLNFKWYKTGSEVVQGTSRTLTVSHTDFDVKAVYTCEVS